MSPRTVPLGGDPKFEVRVVPEAIREFRDHPDAKRLLTACIEVLGQDPHHPTKGKAGLMRGHEPIRKFRPPGAGTTRVYYAIDEDNATIVWLLGIHPRSKDHRTKDLEAARKRLQRHADARDGDEK